MMNNNLKKTKTINTSTSTPVDQIDNPDTFTEKKMVASATKKARPKYSRVTHKAIGSKGPINKFRKA